MASIPGIYHDGLLFASADSKGLFSDMPQTRLAYKGRWSRFVKDASQSLGRSSNRLYANLFLVMTGLEGMFESWPSG